MINMKREKGAAVGLVICFVAMIAIVGIITFKNYERKSEDELAKTEEKMNELQEQAEKEEEHTQVTQGDKVQAQIEPSVEPQHEIIEEAPQENKTSPLSFASNEVLLWPVDGNVLICYSMDETVYFSTLDQYKYNPALIISGEVGEEVIAATECEILSVEETAQTGTTVTVGLGNGFEAVYGQLKDVKVKAGERVDQGEVIGYLNEPTKYYSVEGCNLYFQLIKDGEPTNPLEYLEE